MAFDIKHLYLPNLWIAIFVRLIGCRNLDYLWTFTVLRTGRKMASRFAKVSEEEIVAINEAAFFYPSDLVNTKTISIRVGEEQ